MTTRRYPAVLRVAGSPLGSAFAALAFLGCVAQSVEGDPPPPTGRGGDAGEDGTGGDPQGGNGGTPATGGFGGSAAGGTSAQGGGSGAMGGTGAGKGGSSGGGGAGTGGAGSGGKGGAASGGTGGGAGGTSGGAGTAGSANGGSGGGSDPCGGCDAGLQCLCCAAGSTQCRCTIECSSDDDCGNSSEIDPSYDHCNGRPNGQDICAEESFCG